jgi:subtilisin family serine protease
MFVYMRRLGVVLALFVLAAPSTAEAAPVAAIPTGRALEALSEHRFTLLGLEADPAAERLVAGWGGTIVAPELHIWRLRSTEAQQLIPRLRHMGALRYAEADRPVFRQGHLTAGDPLAVPAIGWHHYRVRADRAEPPGPGVPITVIDSGLDTSHMEFSARPNTFLLNRQLVDLEGDEYHGTIVASTAAAPTDAKGAVGIYPQAVLRSFDLEFLAESVIVEGISRAVAAGRSVINLSLGGDEPSRAIYEATINAFGRGSLIVAAAGNDRLFDNPPIYPADFPHVLTVGSTNQSDQPSDFSSTSQAVDLAAPGEAIPWQHPTDPASWGTANGTSFASPIVAAATAWVWTARGTLDKTQVFDLMRLSARDVSPRGPDARTGLGLLDIPGALTRAAPAIDPLEPNDDIDHVKANGIFRLAARPLTAPGRRRATYRARLHASEDPHDVYRIWVPGRSEVSATIRPNANVDAALWAPKTSNVFERGAARRRDLVASSGRPGTRPELIHVENSTRRGYFAYLDLFPGRGVRSAVYSLGIMARALPSRRSSGR